MPPRDLIPTLPRENEVVAGAIADAGRGRPLLRILEAGCGRRWVVDLGGAARRITGVDLDARALAHRRDVVGDLDEAVHGDLATVSFPPESFDVIYSAYVLEHVAGAEAVLERFLGWLAPGGLLVLKIPERGSVVGWLTRILPFPVHVAFYRYLAEDRDAGKPGHPPYPVVHEPIISLGGLREFSRRHGLIVRHEAGLDFGYHYRHLALSRFQRAKILAVQGFIRMVGWLSLGSLAAGYSGLLFVLEKPVIRSAGASRG
ncbi:MAG TPA: class I SAM-dependent methyltransferase [Dongiaceae bacterium]|nr:class I SAM-dependent methyltransferase [Dongiaceae bacterium]